MRRVGGHRRSGAVMKTAAFKAPEATEAQIQNRLILRLQSAGYLVVRINGAGFQNKKNFIRSYIIAGFTGSGFPDLAAFRGDRFLLFEVKKRGGKLTANQVRFHEFAARFGVKITVIEGAGGLNALRLDEL